jgi:hypothetical protein
MENLGQDSQCSDRHSNRVQPKKKGSVTPCSLHVVLLCTSSDDRLNSRGAQRDPTIINEIQVLLSTEEATVGFTVSPFPTQHQSSSTA